jgi:hypothetical protein
MLTAVRPIDQYYGPLHLLFESKDRKKKYSQDHTQQKGISRDTKYDRGFTKKKKKRKRAIQFAKIEYFVSQFLRKSGKCSFRKMRLIDILADLIEAFIKKGSRATRIF